MRLRHLALLTGVLSTLGVTLVQPRSAEAAFNANYYRIRPAHSNKCLDVANVSAENAARIQQWDCAPSAQTNQLWRVTLQSNGTYMIASLHSGRCLDVTTISSISGQPIANTENGAVLQQWECNPHSPQANQTFVAEFVGQGSYRLHSSISQKCVDVANISQSNGAPIHQWDCAGWNQPNQVFFFEPVAPPNHPSYFGYYASAFDGVGSGNNTAEIADHGNLTWISGGYVPKLAQAASLNMYAVLSITHLFFTGSSGQIGLLSDQEMVSNWNAFAAEVAPYVNNIAAFYPLDEPYIHGVPQAVMKQKLAQIATMIHATFPSKAVAVIFDANVAHFDIPAGFNWVAFDCYGSWDACQGNSIRTYHQALKSRLSPGQKMFLVPDSYLFGNPPSNFLEEDVVGRANHYADLAFSDPDVIAITPFLYDSVNGALPIIRAGFVDIGKAITGR